MDPVDRLAAYLADELSPGEREALEADVARDPVLRGELAAMQRADYALKRVVSVGPPTGYTRRLLDVVDRTLDDVLPGDPPVPLARPPRHAVPRWAPLVAAAAIAVVAIGGVALVVGNIPDPDDMFAADLAEADEAERATEADDSGITSLAVPESGEQPAADGFADGMATPEFRDTGRTVTSDELADYAEEAAALVSTGVLTGDAARAQSAESFARARETPLVGCIDAVETLVDLGILLVIESVQFGTDNQVPAFAVVVADADPATGEVVSIWVAAVATGTCDVLAVVQR
ncbi:MAG: hypothetical protein WD576_03630 [Nitriliruptoraceae bacterium]